MAPGERHEAANREARSAFLRWRKCVTGTVTAFGQLTPLPASGSAMALAIDCARSARAQGRVNLPSVIEGGQTGNLPARHAGALSAAWEGLSACERLIGVGEH